jgi:hypothetical protein
MRAVGFARELSGYEWDERTSTLSSIAPVCVYASLAPLGNLQLPGRARRGGIVRCRPTEGTCRVGPYPPSLDKHTISFVSLYRDLDQNGRRAFILPRAAAPRRLSTSRRKVDSNERAGLVLGLVEHDDGPGTRYTDSTCLDHNCKNKQTKKIVKDPSCVQFEYPKTVSSRLGCPESDRVFCLPDLLSPAVCLRCASQQEVVPK